MSYEKMKPYVLPKAKDVVFSIKDEVETLKRLLLSFANKYKVNIVMLDEGRGVGLHHKTTTGYISNLRLKRCFFVKGDCSENVGHVLNIEHRVPVSPLAVLELMAQHNYELYSEDGDLLIQPNEIHAWNHETSPTMFCSKFLYKCLYKLLQEAYHGDKDKDLWDIEGYGSLYSHNFKLLSEFISLNKADNEELQIDGLQWYNQKLRSPVFQRDVDNIYNVANNVFERIWREMCHFSSSPNWLEVDLTQTAIPTQIMLHIEGDHRLIQWYKQAYDTKETVGELVIYPVENEED